MKNSKIGVLQIIDKLSMDGVNPSSCTNLFAEWIPRFQENKFDVKVCTLRNPDRAGRVLEDLGIKVFYINKGKMSPGNIKEISNLIRQEGIDIVHLHGYSAANFGRIAARKMGIKNVVHEHAVLKVLPHQFMADWFLKNYTDIAIAVSDAVKQFMIKGRSIPEERIRVIRNGINIDKFAHVNNKGENDFLARYGIPKEALKIGTITRLREEKGNEFFMKAAALVLKKYPNSFFVIVGEGPLRNKLQELAGRLNIQDRVILTGFIEDIIPVLHSLDIVVIPSLREGFGIALIEAMAAKKPIVATNVGGLAEIAKDNITALLVRPGDENSLAGKIHRLLQNDELRTKLAVRAYHEAKNYSIERNVQALEDLYLSLFVQENETSFASKGESFNGSFSSL